MLYLFFRFFEGASANQMGGVSSQVGLGVRFYCAFRVLANFASLSRLLSILLFGVEGCEEFAQSGIWVAEKCGVAGSEVRGELESVCGLLSFLDGVWNVFFCGGFRRLFIQLQFPFDFAVEEGLALVPVLRHNFEIFGTDESGTVAVEAVIVG